MQIMKHLLHNLLHSTQQTFYFEYGCFEILKCENEFEKGKDSQPAQLWFSFAS